MWFWGSGAAGLCCDGLVGGAEAVVVVGGVFAAEGAEVGGVVVVAVAYVVDFEAGAVGCCVGAAVAVGVDPGAAVVVSVEDVFAEGAPLWGEGCFSAGGVGLYPHYRWPWVRQGGSWSHCQAGCGVCQSWP